MALRSNLKSLAPRRELYKREIQLLSRGYINPTAFPEGRITVYPWDSEIDTWMVENLRRLSKEELVYGLLERCCNLNGCKLDEFIVGEITLVLLVSRARLTSDRINYRTMCPLCGHQADESALIPDELQPEGVKESGYPGYDEITLPEIKDVVRVQPLQIKHEKAIVNRPAPEKVAVSDTVMRTVMSVASVNDTRPDTSDELVAWFRALSPSDCRFLEDQTRLLAPHLNTAIPHKCDECGNAFNHPLDFSQGFFR